MTQTNIHMNHKNSVCVSPGLYIVHFNYLLTEGDTRFKSGLVEAEPLCSRSSIPFIPLILLEVFLKQNGDN